MGKAWLCPHLIIAQALLDALGEEVWVLPAIIGSASSLKALSAQVGRLSPPWGPHRFWLVGCVVSSGEVPGPVRGVWLLPAIFTHRHLSSQPPLPHLHWASMVRHNQNCSGHVHSCVS